MTDPGPVSQEEVLRAEYAALRPAGPGAPLRALCLSGGGIRSATFALGVIQWLAERGLLEQFDYLSTVSGGGYIGGWLSAWIYRAQGLAGVLPGLRPNAEVPAGQPDPVQHLRDYNNYLTPRLGALSADAWTVASTITRNVFLNWLVFIPLLLCALMLPRLALAFSVEALAAPALAVTVVPGVAALLLAMSLWNILRYLPGAGGVNHSTADFLAKVLAPLGIAAILFSDYESVRAIAFGPVVELLVALCLCVWLVYRVTVGRGARRRHDRLERGSLAGAVVVLGLGLGAAAWLFQDLMFTVSWPQQVTVGPPLLLLGFAVAGAIFVGLSSHVLGTQDREWMARAAAYLSIACVVWVAACAAVLLAPGWIFGHPWKEWFLSLLGVASAWTSAHVGFRSPDTGDAAAKTKSPGTLAPLLLKVAPAAFLVLLALGLAIFTDWALVATGTTAASWNDHFAVLMTTRSWWTLAWTAAFLVIGWFMARYININKFSLQGMYRDRLVRAYLGASNPKSNANRFTGFSNTDDIALHELRPEQRPLHVVNMTLNLVGGERLAWQQRKAESFTATALHCGSSGVGYRDAARYGDRDGITLGTAVAISGAAASPNMGYHSSPVVGFIMTLFNVRLGAWLGNPGPAGAKTWTNAGPRSATRALLREALGQTTDRSDYVYLSDGGHFENLGLYEMIRRRCRSIVVVDGGCDPQFTFEDLGNALRKIRIDLKVPIKFVGDSEACLREQKKRCAVAKIVYSAVDGPDAADGELIYIKPMILGTEPPDVASYHAAHPTFPHQSTAEQWFDESQTESYRMLGIFTVADMCRGWKGASLEEWSAHLEGTLAEAAGAMPE